MNIELVYEKLRELLQSKRPRYHHGICKLVAGSDTSGAVSFEQSLYDANNISLEYILEGFGDVADLAREFFLIINENEKYNILEFSFTSPIEYTYKYYWDQSVQDEFDKYLPKHKKDKVIPWYVPGSEYREKKAEQEAQNQTQSTPAAKSWQPVGELQEEFEIQYLDPIHHGYPRWAGTRCLQLWQTRWNTYMVCTQGLHEANNEHSLGLELYLETEEKPDPFSSSWQANIVYELGKLLPKVTDLKERFETYKYISVQIAMEEAPEEWSLKEHDNIGVLFGIEHEEFQKRNLHFTFRPLNCKLLRPAEVRLIKRMNVQGREKLVNFFRQKGTATLSSLDRPSAVKDE